MERDRLLTVKEAAEALRLSAVTIRRWLKSGRIESSDAHRTSPRA